MITYQDVRRNMCEAEKIYANDKVSAQRIEEENARKKSIAVAESNRKRNSNSVHLDATEIRSRDRTTNTREQRARLSGVSTGTVARYDTVMTNNRELQQSYYTLNFILS